MFFLTVKDYSQIFRSFWWNLQNDFLKTSFSSCHDILVNVVCRETELSAFGKKYPRDGRYFMSQWVVRARRFLGVKMHPEWNRLWALIL